MNNEQAYNFLIANEHKEISTITTEGRPLTKSLKVTKDILVNTLINHDDDDG